MGGENDASLIRRILPIIRKSRGQVSRPDNQRFFSVVTAGREFIFFARPKKTNQKKGRPRHPPFSTATARLGRSTCTRIPARTSLNRPSLADCPSRRAASVGRVKGEMSLTARRAEPDITEDSGICASPGCTPPDRYAHARSSGKLSTASIESASSSFISKRSSPRATPAQSGMPASSASRNR